MLAGRSGFPDEEQGLAVFDGFAAFDQNLFDCAVDFGADFVHDFHRFDDADDGVPAHGVAFPHEGGGFRRGCAVECADDWAFDCEQSGVVRRERRRGGRSNVAHNTKGTVLVKVIL